MKFRDYFEGLGNVGDGGLGGASELGRMGCGLVTGCCGFGGVVIGWLVFILVPA
ncbi:MAG: hypothetical protein AB8B55_17705 [Mariniblastus sp.]